MNPSNIVFSERSRKTTYTCVHQSEIASLRRPDTTRSTNMGFHTYGKFHFPWQHIFMNRGDALNSCLRNTKVWFRKSKYLPPSIPRHPLTPGRFKQTLDKNTHQKPAKCVSVESKNKLNQSHRAPKTP